MNLIIKKQRTKTEVLKDLKKEINNNLLWFAEMDIKETGKISDSTKEIFKKQNIDIEHLFFNMEVKNESR